MSNIKDWRFRGLNTHRFNENALEEEFALEWSRRHISGSNTLARLLDEGNHTPAEPSDRDYTVAATVIQWLGSPGGKDFLRACGFVHKDNP